jgi:hypothetical protein
MGAVGERRRVAQFLGQRVDVLYRSLQQCQRVLDDCTEGRWELHWAQQPPYGYFSPTFVEELAVCMPLFDRSESLQHLRARARAYPDALRRRIVQDFLWSIEFNLSAFLPKYVSAADAYGFAGCASRICFQLVQVVYALNATWPPPDRVALNRAAALSIRPADLRRACRGCWRTWAPLRKSNPTTPLNCASCGPKPCASATASIRRECRRRKT